MHTAGWDLLLGGYLCEVGPKQLSFSTALSSQCDDVARNFKASVSLHKGHKG